MGPLALGLVTVEPSDGTLHLLAEVTLVLVLFSDAAKLDARRLWHESSWVIRMLLLGLPLVILAGTGGAKLLFPQLGLWEAALLAAMLAATDAALGGTVLDDERVPDKIRDTLNAESGLNDGLALPFVLFLAQLAVSPPVGDGSLTDWLGSATLQLVLGPLAGLAVGCGGGWLISWCERREWTLESAEGMVSLALALGAFALAEAIGGNGFLAAFTAGLSFRATLGRRNRFLYEFEEEEATILTLFTFGAFGCVLVPAALPHLGWRHVVFALAVLTVLRMVPIALVLTGTDASWRTRLLLGWFGPRGLASLLFLLLILPRGSLPHGDTLFAAVVTTVLLSVVLHGFTARPLGAWCGGREVADQGGSRDTS